MDHGLPVELPFFSSSFFVKPEGSTKGSTKGYIRGPWSPPLGAKVETKNHHKTMKIKVPEAEILRTPIKIEKLSLWNRSRSGFIMNCEFHLFLVKTTLPFSTFIKSKNGPIQLFNPINRGRHTHVH